MISETGCRAVLIRAISSVLLMFFIVGCVSVGPTVSPPVRSEPVDIGGGVVLTFPIRPSYPVEARLSQLITTTHNGQEILVQGDLYLGPDRVMAVFSYPGGPPVLTIRWMRAGMDVIRDSSVPAALDGRRILADIFLANWPILTVQAHLSGEATLVSETGRRIVMLGGRTILEIAISDTSSRTKIALHNHAQGYVLTIVS